MNVNIYADEMLFINFAVNTAIILTGKKMLNKATHIIKDMLLAAMFSVFSFFVIISPLRDHINFLLVAIPDIIMVLILFKPKNVSEFIKYTAVVKISSLFINEAYLLLRHYFGIGNMIILVCGAGLSYLSVILLRYIIKSNTYYHSVNIMRSNKSVNTVGLVDTGNSLIEPISRKPVIIAELRAIKELLPKDFAMLYTSEGKCSLMDAVASINDEQFRKSIRIIPFNSIGNENGVMLGFVADKVDIDGNSIKKPIVAIYKNDLCKNGLYNTLLSPRHIGGV